MSPVNPLDRIRPREEAFVDLVYADEDLLRAEFDAIIAAAWPSPPVTGRPRQHWVPRPPGRSPAVLGSERGCRPGSSPRTQDVPRERAPPH